MQLLLVDTLASTFDGVGDADMGNNVVAGRDELPGLERLELDVSHESRQELGDLSWPADGTCQGTSLPVTLKSQRASVLTLDAMNGTSPRPNASYTVRISCTLVSFMFVTSSF